MSDLHQGNFRSFSFRLSFSQPALFGLRKLGLLRNRRWIDRSGKFEIEMSEIYREVDIGDGGAVHQEDLDDAGRAGPGGQVQWAGALFVGRVAGGLISQEQLDNVPKRKIVY